MPNRKAILRVLLRNATDLLKLDDAGLVDSICLCIRDTDDDPPIGVAVFLLGEPAANQATLDGLDEADKRAIVYRFERDGFEAEAMLARAEVDESVQPQEQVQVERQAPEGLAVELAASEIQDPKRADHAPGPPGDLPCRAPPKLAGHAGGGSVDRRR